MCTVRGVVTFGASTRLALCLALLAGCGGDDVRRSADHEVVWVDPDTHPFEGPPEVVYSSFVWDGVDHSVVRPAIEAGRLRAPREAANVNAMDEVPSSSWYVNRLAARTMTPAEVARGPCDDTSSPPEPWTIVEGKPDGSNPGFVVRDAAGDLHLLKPDGGFQPERASAADAIASRIWHAAGFFVPCNRVVLVEPDRLERAPDAQIERTNGDREPLTEGHVEAVLAHAAPTPDGRFRMLASQFVEGEPLGHWRYEGTRADDPNDVIAHESRRELRAQRLLSAWTNRVDARHENTLEAWIAVDARRGYLRHYVIDFGDCFGVLVHHSVALSRRLGHSGYFDVEHLTVDLLTLGRLDRPWDEPRRGAAWPTLGYYDAEGFDPEAWRPGYPNPAYDRMTEADAAWMARIIARLTPRHLAALVRVGRFSDPVVAAELSRILAARRIAILERYLTALSPLAWPRVEVVDGAPRVCLQDLAVWTSIRDAESRRYRAEAVGAELPQPPFASGDAQVCLPLPAGAGDLVVDVYASSVDREEAHPARLRLRVEGGGARLLGLERPVVERAR